MLATRRTLLALALVPAATVPGQDARAGFALAARYQSTGVQAGITAMAASTDGRTLWVAHRHLLYAVDSAGTPTLAHAFASHEWLGTIAVDPRDDSVWFTNFTTNALYVHDPRAQQTRQVTLAPRNLFDLAFDAPSGVLLASANPAWPNPGARAGIWRIDTGGGPHREVVQLAGPSGPLAFDRDGNLLYATQVYTVPPPPASTDVVRFQRAALIGALFGPPLTMRDATFVVRAFDGAYDLAVDAHAQCYVSDGWSGQVWRADLGNGTREATPFVATGTAGTTHLAWLPGPGPATFAAFQPAGGGTLLVVVDDVANQRSTAFAIAAARPTLDVWPSNPVPRGPARLLVAGAAPSAPCILLLSPLPPVPEFSAGTLLGAPLWLGLDLGAPLFTLPALADATGHATWPFTHAGGSGSLTVQALAFAGTGAGTSPSVGLALAP